ncbi:hypothetical protein L1987_63614 [Smallanthus sonchifolius]|uniref:Uncharacterized protein n=1 Tax=Smallanthus sonchifolius TaxID=185202 RepID=A0ACB9CDS1_9ASTR|nr:hypothetical protein L1987_63614 [Smallanthus sonchifolius]
MSVFVLHPLTEGQVIPLVSIPVVPVTPFAPRPLCNYQMALANQACAYLPFIQIPPPAPRTPFDPLPSDEDTPEPEHRHRHRHVHGHGHTHSHEHDEDPDPDPDHSHDHDHAHNHDHNHNRRHDHGHKQQHHHHHHHRHRDTPVEEQCCKWLAQVDDQCVCELLVHLPPFLARPVHNYAVIIGRACNFTFSCGSGFRK